MRATEFLIEGHELFRLGNQCDRVKICDASTRRRVVCDEDIFLLSVRRGSQPKAKVYELLWDLRGQCPDRGDTLDSVLPHATVPWA